LADNWLRHVQRKHVRELTVHNWVYGLKDGIARDLNVGGSSFGEIFSQYQKSLPAG
jgi:carbonic anhydrase